MFGLTGITITHKFGALETGIRNKILSFDKDGKLISVKNYDGNAADITAEILAALEVHERFEVIRDKSGNVQAKSNSEKIAGSDSESANRIASDDVPSAVDPAAPSKGSGKRGKTTKITAD